VDFVGPGGFRYRVLRPHAKGGLGEVFVALDQELHREVALKEIQALHADNANSRGRFVLEAEITGRLEHPGIVPVYGLGAYADGRPFYAMRFIKGDNLKQAIARFHRQGSTDFADSTDKTESVESVKSVDRFSSLEFRNLLGRFLDVCNAVAYAHSRGVLHRDLKPGNVMLGQFGETLVVDWGLAKVVGRSEPGAGEGTLIASGSSIVETLAGSAVGTPAYMSPEQAEGKLDALGPRSDIYSLGAILYCLLTGQPPVRGDDAAVILEKVRRGDITAPRKLRPDVPPALEAICLEALALRPADRYPAVLALADDVKRWLADEPVSAYGEPWPVRAGRWARKHKPLVSGAAAALLVGLIAAAAGVLWYQEEQNREALRRAEAERKTMLAGAAVRHALEQAESAVEDLHDILKKPGGVFELLNRPENWQARIKLAEAALDRARALAKAETGLDPKLGAAADNLQAALRQDEDDRRLAVRLEKIRMDQAALVEGKFDFTRAAREYPQTFAEAGLAMPEGETEALATRIRSSRIKDQLVAALDDWAAVAYRLRKEELAERVLATGR
jgi:serine/threonine protein kinase